MLNAIIVTILDDKKVVFESVGCGQDISCFSTRGFLEKGKSYCVSFENESEQIIAITKLIEIDALFSYGQGWAPSQIMDYLKEKNKINMSYKEIAWNGSGNYVITER
ncbi:MULTISPECIES: hypothetical protein [Pantoea]|uniref:Uncharacterized protein n=1 Tax=Pantoea allii TaxID=574096 RepID=A0ABS6V9Z9_9GAMM|nr:MULTISPECIES: hypothetical protein [Pantoea]MBW1212744.1 hypothetical protein [Pantoea allii]MBW1255618.1 hypothetical protein [Pantoea allii]MBW1264695.1 hypothetical protein [Pantoea allii]MBW1286812.1 hypothetical protein [Pantoea allii]TWD41669.1 hypothetical protein FBY13_10416 [Pantoea sp. SJZ147]